MRSDSPYWNKNSEDEKKNVRDKLLKDYPIKEKELIHNCKQAWEIIKKIEIDILGNKINLVDLELHGSIYGGLIDTVLREVIIKSDESKWMRPNLKVDKDVIYIDDNKKSLEIKSGGQKNTQVFGNRSSNLEEKNEQKSMAGYYITINYYNKELYLIRFGWLDEEDWIGQVDGGQQAKISEDAYELKLKILYGSYLMNTPTDLLLGYNLNKDDNKLKDDGKVLKALGNIGNLIKYTGDNDSVLKLKHTIIFSGKVNLTGKTIIDLYEFLKCNDNDIEKLEIKEIILKEALNIKINQIKDFNIKSLANISLMDLINETFNVEDDKVKNAIKRIKGLDKLKIKKLVRPSTYTSNSLDIDLYREYIGEDAVLNMAKEFFKK